MTKTLAAPLLDEVKLARAAVELAAQFKGHIPTRAELQSLTQSRGIDLSTRALYQTLIDSNRDFMQTIDRIEPDPSPAPAKLKLLIAPALFYKERPEFGGDGQTIAEIARACGIETDVLPVLSKGACADNAVLIWRAIESESAERIALLSMSKGGAETRLALEAHCDHPAMNKVRAWVNISGFVRGSPHADQVLASWSLKLRVRLLCLVLGADYRMVDELATYNSRWLQPFALPENITIINLFGVPLLSHIQQHNQYNRYVRLTPLGPNDGFTVLADMIVPNTLTYPLWGADHYFRTPQVSPLLYRVFEFIKSSASVVE